MILPKRVRSLPALSFALGFATLGAVAIGPISAATPPPIQVCLEAAADASPVYPTDVIPSTNQDAAAVFRLAQTEAFRTLDFAWIAVDVGSAAPRNYEIARGSLTLEGRRAGVLRLTGLQNPLPPGKYQLDVWADKAPWHSQTFSVAAAMPLRLATPSDLFPLAPAKTWTYAFVQEAGAGARVSLPGISPGPDGKLRAAVTMTVTRPEAGATKIETRRNGLLVFEEWWRLDDHGLFAIRRQEAAGQEVTLAPPQKLLAFPPGPQSWDYQADDRSFKQTSRMWGPVPIAGPTGSPAGFVVLTQQTSGLATTTVERHFVPGVGLVREVLITALGGELLTRQELVLQP